MKKIFVVLSMVILFTNVVMAAPEATEVSRLKKIFNITDVTDFKVTSSENTYDDGGTFKSYFYTWTNKDTTYSVTTDASGNIFNFYTSSTTPDTSFQHLSKNDLESIANSFLKKIDPKLVEQYKLTSTSTFSKNGQATLVFNRYVNNIKVINDIITIEIQFDKKAVTQFDRTNSSSKFKDEAFPKLEKAIPLNEIYSKLESNNPLTLAYLVTGDEKNQVGNLVYTHLLEPNSFDALTSKPITILDPVYEKALSADAASDLSDVEITELDKIKNIKTESEVQKFIEKNFNVKSLKLNGKHLMLDADKNYYYSFYYDSTDENKPSYLSINISAKDLTVLSFSDSDYGTKEASITKDEALKISKAFLDKFNKAKNISSNPIVEIGSNITTILYPRMENKIPVIGEGITIQISNSMKKVSNYNFVFSKAKFPAVSKTISLEKAKEIAKKDFVLNYTYVKNAPFLVYSYSNGNPIIRATDGALLSANGEEMQNLQISYSNLDKSKYKNEIEVLTDLNIGFYKISDLTQTIKVKDFLELMESMDSGAYPTNDYSFYYSQYEDLNEKMYEQNLTYKDAIKWTLNSLGIKNLKKSAEVWDKKYFKDYDKIQKDYLAYYYLSKATGIYDKDESLQNENITAEEMLHIIYKTVTK